MEKNNIYELYFANKIDESSLIIALDNLQEKLIKEDGVIYTPMYIVKEMIKIADPSKEMNILEPSCGHGIFLIGLLEFMKNKYFFSGEELLEWFKNKVVAIEISENTVIEARNILSAYFKKHFSLDVNVNYFSNINIEDSLKFNVINEIDLCIGNPPYIRAKNLEATYLKYIKLNYSSCSKGTIDIYFAFIEKYINVAKKLVFITPNSFLTSKSGKVLKEKILTGLEYLIDFKEKKIFKDASVYTCIFMFSKSSNKIDFLYGNDVGNVSLISKDKYINYDSEHCDGIYQDVLSGIATLADNVFLVKKDENGKFYAFFDNTQYEIEKEMVVPYLKLTKIKSNDDLNNIDYMIYPYDCNKKIITEDIISKQFPLLYSYLLRVKEKLSQRDKGKTDKYESWYAYGRKQGLHNINTDKVINIPMMIGAECKPIRLDISNLIKTYGKIVFTSGYLIPEINVNIDYSHLLGKDFVDFAKENGKVWPGKNECYYSLTVKQIKSFKKIKDNNIYEA